MCRRISRTRHGSSHTRVQTLSHSAHPGNYYRGIGITVDYGYYKLSGKYKKVEEGGMGLAVR